MGSKKFIRKAAKVVTNVDPFNIIPDKIQNTIAPIVLSAINPALGAAYSGLNSFGETGNVGSSLARAGGSYVGGQLGSAYGAGTGGTVGNALNTALGDTLGSAVLPSLGGKILGANLGSTVGGFLGSSVGADLASSLVPQKTANNVGEGVASTAPFKASRAAPMEAPASIKGLGSLTDTQQSSNIATGGVYGGGQGPDEQNYFLNLINRRLVDDSGNVDSDFSDIGGVENSYLAQLGLGNKKNPNDLLSAISSWRT